MMATTILCLFRQPLPGVVSPRVVSPTGAVAEVRVEEDDRRVAEITVEKSTDRSASFLGRATAAASSAVASVMGKGDVLGKVELSISEGDLSASEHREMLAA